jgi:hypothetical protein
MAKNVVRLADIRGQATPPAITDRWLHLHKELIMSHRHPSHFSRVLIALQTAMILGACAPMVDRRPETALERDRSVKVGVLDIVDARCDLEERCANIGPRGRFESRSACESKMQGETAITLNTADCPMGVERRKLDACVASILAQDCGSIFDALNRWNACRDGQICYSRND